MLTLTTPIINLSRVGQATAKRFKKLGLETVSDLLFYFPFRYDDFSRLTPIKQLQPGTSASIVGQIELIQNKRSPRKRIYLTEALISDGQETIKVIWFNQPFIARNLKVGDLVSLAGKVEEEYGSLILLAPGYEKLKPTTNFSLDKITRQASEVGLDLAKRPWYRGAIHTQGLVPNYHLTSNLSQKQIRSLIKQVLPLSSYLTDWLPLEVKKSLPMLSLSQAIKKIHFPACFGEIEQARRRLAFDELFLVQLQAQLVKKDLQTSLAPAIIFNQPATKKFVASLPFKLTNDQRRAAWEIIKDLGKQKPMARLLEGDVGSGKTIVACLAMLNVALNQKQAVLMVPTEILAIQHFNTLSQLFKKFKIRIALLTRSAKKLNQAAGEKKKLKEKEIKEKIKQGEVKIIIGTHAIIQEDVYFYELALAIIDEQHRFGVEQRKALVDKTLVQASKPETQERSIKFMPHLLSMTATPIPRSLALALFGDLDLSIIEEMPKGRKKIITQIVPESQREQAYQFIRQQIEQNRQVFVICPLIDFSDRLGVKSVEEEYEKLKKEVFTDLPMAKLHGRMKGKEKEKIMQEFLAGKIKILVSTSVVEVGVDVPNATTMMIEGAERFGLAQIHQFRGRVGRAEHQSYCFLFTESQAERALKRLQAAVEIDSGFELAKIDLKFRGPGEVYGTAQKGFPELKIASLFDYQLAKEAQIQASKLLSLDAEMTRWPLLKQKLRDWEKQVHLE